VLSAGFLWETPIEPYISVFRDAGFHQLELVFTREAWPRPRIQTLQRIAEQEGVAFPSLHAPFFGVDLSSPDDWLWEHSIARIREAMERAVDLGADVVVVHPGGIYSDGPDHRLRLTRVIASFERLLDETRDFPVRIAVENLMPHFWGTRLDDLMALMRHFEEEPRLGMCLDTSHLVLSRLSFEDFWQVLGHRVIHLHLSDNWGEGYDDHVPPHLQGNVPWLLLFDRLVHVRFPGPLTFEIYHMPGDIPFHTYIHRLGKELKAFLREVERLSSEQLG